MLGIDIIFEFKRFEDEFQNRSIQFPNVKKKYIYIYNSFSLRNFSIKKEGNDANEIAT